MKECNKIPKGLKGKVHKMTKFSAIAALGPGLPELGSSQWRMETQKTADTYAMVLVLWSQSKEDTR